MTGPTVAELDFAALEDLKESLPQLATNLWLICLILEPAKSKHTGWTRSLRTWQTNPRSHSCLDAQDVLMVWQCVSIRLGTRKQ